MVGWSPAEPFAADSDPSNESLRST